jgi:sulfite exporter TauE/SafE
MPVEFEAGGGLLSAWLLGVSMGLTACTITCLPFMGSWVLGRGGLRREALADTAAFLSGRVATYAMLGAVAGAFGAWFTEVLASGLGHVAVGLSSIVAGLYLLRPTRRHMPCGAKRRGAEAPPFLLGASLSLTPCAPLASLLAACALASSAIGGLGFGLAFGLGAAVTPLILLLPALGFVGRQLTGEKLWVARALTWGAAGLLIVLGVRRLVLAV